MILLVEDEASLRAVIARRLARSGYEVIQAGSGPEALAVAGTNDFDLLITDVGMPEMSGPELVGLLTQQRETLPTIYMSGYMASPLGELKYHERFIKKPFPAADLIHCIQDLLGDGSP